MKRSRFSEEQVARELDRIVAERGVPLMIVSGVEDYKSIRGIDLPRRGTELTSLAVLQ